MLGGDLCWEGSGGMTGQELALSVPGDLAPPAPRRPSRRVFREVSVVIPEGVALFAEREAEDSGQTVEEIIAGYVLTGFEHSTREPGGTSGWCPDGRPHLQGTINPRYCARCATPMTPPK